MPSTHAITTKVGQSFHCVHVRGPAVFTLKGITLVKNLSQFNHV